jgi:hypothetical protein
MFVGVAMRLVARAIRASVAQDRRECQQDRKHCSCQIQILEGAVAVRKRRHSFARLHQSSRTVSATSFSHRSVMPSLRRRTGSGMLVKSHAPVTPALGGRVRAALDASIGGTNESSMGDLHDRIIWSLNISSSGQLAVMLITQTRRCWQSGS